MLNIVNLFALIALAGVTILAFLFIAADSFRTEPHYHISPKGYFYSCDHSYCSSPSSPSPPLQTPVYSTSSASVAHRASPACECKVCRSRHPSFATSVPTELAGGLK